MPMLRVNFSILIASIDGEISKKFRLQNLVSSMVNFLLSLFIKLAFTQLVLFEDEKILQLFVNPRIPSLLITPGQSYNYSKIVQAKVIGNKDSIEIFLLTSISAGYLLSKSNNKSPFFVNDTLKSLGEFKTIYEILKEDVQCYDFLVQPESIELVCSTHSQLMYFLCQTDCTLKYQFRHEQIITKAVLGLVRQNLRSLTFNQDWLIEVHRKFDVESSQTDYEISGPFKVREHDIMLDPLIYENRDFLNSFNLERCCILNGTEYFQNKKICSPFEIPNNLHAQQTNPIKISKDNHYLLNDFNLTFEFHESHNFILLNQIERSLIIFNQTLIWYDSFVLETKVDLVCPYAIGSFLVINGSAINLLQLNQFRNYQNQDFPIEQVTQYHPTLEKFIKSTNQIYIHFRSVGEQKLLVDQSQILLLSDEIVVEKSPFPIQISRVSDFSNPCNMSNIVYFTSLQDVWLLQVREGQQFKIILIDCLVMNKPIQTYTSDLLLTDDLVASTHENLYVVQGERQILLEVQQGRTQNFEKRISSVKSALCRRVLVEFADNTSILLERDFKIIEQPQICTLYWQQFRFDQKRLFLGSLFTSEIQAYEFEYPILSYEILGKETLLLWFGGACDFLVLYYYSQLKLYKLRDLPLFGYTPKQNTTNSISFNDAYIAIKVQNSKQELRVLLIQYHVAYCNAVRQIIPLKADETFLLLQTAVLLKRGCCQSAQTRQLIMSGSFNNAGAENLIETITLRVRLNGYESFNIDIFLLGHQSDLVMKQHADTQVRARVSSSPLSLDVRKYIEGQILEIQGDCSIKAPLQLREDIIYEQILGNRLKLTGKILNDRNLLYFDGVQLLIGDLMTQEFRVLLQFQFPSLLQVFIEPIKINRIIFGCMIIQYYDLLQRSIQSSIHLVDLFRMSIISNQSLSEFLKARISESLVVYDNLICLQESLMLRIFEVQNVSGYFQFTALQTWPIRQPHQLELADCYLLISRFEDSNLHIQVYNLSEFQETNLARATLSKTINVLNLEQNYSKVSFKVASYSLLSFELNLQSFRLKLGLFKTDLLLILMISGSIASSSSVTPLQLIDFCNRRQQLRLHFQQNRIYSWNSSNNVARIDYYSLDETAKKIYSQQTIILSDCLSGKLIASSQTYIVLTCLLEQRKLIFKKIEVQSNYLLYLEPNKWQINLKIRGESNSINLRLRLIHGTFTIQLAIIVVCCLLMMFQIYYGVPQKNKDKVDARKRFRVALAKSRL